MKVTVLDMKTFPSFLQSNYPLNTRRKLNVSKTFSKRPERLLNVLCGFSLHPVPRGRKVDFLQSYQPAAGQNFYSWILDSYFTKKLPVDL